MNWRCFRLRSSGASSSATWASNPQTEEEQTNTSSPTDPASHRSSTQSPSPTISLTSHEYLRATGSESYKEMWWKMHPDPSDEVVSPVISSVLRPGPDLVAEALRGVAASADLADYFVNSENTSRLCLDLKSSIDRARLIYSPLGPLLDLDLDRPFSRPQCESAYDRLLAFDATENPFFFFFSSSTGFDEIHRCFEDLRRRLHSRLRRARKKDRIHRSVARGSALCVIGSVVGIAVAGLVVATHAVVALVAGPPAILAFLRHPSGRIRDDISRLDAAAKGTFVLKNDLDTIQRLVERLHETVEGDKETVRVVVERERGQRYPIQGVIRQLKNNRPCFQNQLTELEEHICLCFAAVNRARALLLQHIHQQRR